MKIVNRKTLTCGLLVATSFGLMAPASADDNRTGPGWNPWGSHASAQAAGVPGNWQFNQDKVVSELRVEPSPEAKALLEKYDLPADYFEKAIKATNDDKFFAIVSPEVEFNDELFKELTPNTEGLSHDVSGLPDQENRKKQIGGHMLVESDNITTSEAVTFPQLAPGEFWNPSMNFEKDGKRMASVMARTSSVFGPEQNIIETYPSHSRSTLTTSDENYYNYNIFDTFKATPERKADVLSAGNRYLEEDTLVDCTVDECVIPFQMAYTGYVLDENGDIDLSDTDVDGNPVPSVQTVISSEVVEVKVTSVMYQERPANVGRENALVYKGIDPAVVDPSWAQFAEQGWVGEVFYSPLSSTRPGIVNGDNAVEIYKPNMNEFSASTMYFSSARFFDSTYNLSFGTNIINNTDHEFDVTYGMNVFATDAEGNRLADAEGVIEEGTRSDIDGDHHFVTVNGVRNFQVDITQDTDEDLSQYWLSTLDLNSSDLNTMERTVTLDNGSELKMKIISFDETTISVAVEVIGGPEEFTMSTMLNDSARDDSKEGEERWESSLGGIWGGGGGWAQSSDVLPGYALNNAETRGVIPEVPETPAPEPEPTPTPEVPEPTPTPETPAPEPEPTPEVPEPTPTPETPAPETPAPEPEPTPEVPEPEVPETPAPEVPVTTDSDVAAGETPTMSGASLFAPAVALLGLIGAGAVWLRQKVTRKGKIGN